MYGRTMPVASGLGKFVAIVLPILFISLLQINAIQNDFLGFFVLADAPRKRVCNPISNYMANDCPFTVLLSLVGGCIFVGAIIRKYVKTRRQFRSSVFGYHWDFEESRKAPTSPLLRPCT